jgi:hypothetical protein
LIGQGQENFLKVSIFETYAAPKWIGDGRAELGSYEEP